MIKWELLLVSISIAILSLSMTTINTPTHFTINFKSYTLKVPNLVQEAIVTISQNKSGLITEVLINHDIVVNVTSATPYTMYLKPGTYTFSIIKEVNESDGKILNVTYNATITYTIQKVKLVLHQKLFYYSGMAGTIIGLLIYVIKRIFVKKRFDY